MQNDVLTSPPATHHEALKQLRLKAEVDVKKNGYVPFTYPMVTLGFVVLFLFFLIPPSSRLHSKFTRYAVFAVTAAWHAHLIINTRAYAMPSTFGVGIVSMWGILWSAVVLVFNDAKSDFRRVKKLDNAQIAVKDEKSSKQMARTCNGSESHQTYRKKYMWQSYPIQPRRERWEWVLDILCNFRGVGWNWAITVIPPRPTAVQRDLLPEPAGNDLAQDIPVSRNGIKRYDSHSSIIRHNVWLICKGYLALDVMKLLINRDPYFWGQLDCKAPQHLPTIIQNSFFLLRSYRLVMVMSLIWLVLRTTFAIGPLLFVGLLGDQHLGCNGEPWMYVDHYGSYSNVLERGLAGWWGGWWHQTFRFAFQSTGDWVIRQLNIKPKSSHAKMVQLFVAFILSGMLHGCGSMTMLGDTRPWSSMFLFFLLQPIGILLEATWRAFIKEAGLAPLVPIRLSQTCNFVWAHLWFYMTAPLLADDFARGGAMLFEPLMLSPLRGLGFGVEGDGFFCWGGNWIKWYTDPTHWWRSGIVL